MNDRPEVPVAKRVDCSRVAGVIMSYLGTGNCYNTDGWCFHLLLFLTLKLLYHLRFIKSHQSQGSYSQNHSTYNWKHFMIPTEQQVEKLLRSLLGSTRDQQTCTAWMEFPFQTGLTPLLPPGMLNKQKQAKQWYLCAWILVRHCSKHFSVSMKREVHVFCQWKLMSSHIQNCIWNKNWVDPQMV